MDLAGLIFDALSGLAGVVALYISVRAYRVAQDSYTVAREQGRKTFELEVLRELIATLRRPDSPFSGQDVNSLLAMLPYGELPKWTELNLRHILYRAEHKVDHPVAPEEVMDLHIEAMAAMKERME